MLAVNLRGDLAKLSDAELAERLEAAWQTYDAARKPSGWLSWPAWSCRGPVRHPRAYRFVTLMQGGSGSPLDLLIAFFFSSKRYERWFGTRGQSASDLSLCEIRDITDDVERRLTHRNKSAA